MTSQIILFLVSVLFGFVPQHGWNGFLIAMGGIMVGVFANIFWFGK